MRRAGDDGDHDGAEADEQQIRVAERLEALGTLAGGLAHDLNNILTVIVTTSGMLRGKLQGRDVTHDADLRTIEQAAVRGSLLARRLLTFGRPDVGRLAPTDVSAVVTGSLELLQRLAGTTVNIVADLTFDGTRATADPVQLEQVLLNLVVNAVDAMPGGGTITISLRPVRLDAARARERGLSGGDYVELAVRDTGEGIGPEILDDLWKPFFTTKREKGTGLGLSAVHRIVAEHGGAVAVESQPGSGATFRIWLRAAVTRAGARRSSSGFA